jgi:hypothetical protein
LGSGASLREVECLVLLARELDYMSDAQYQQITASASDTFAPLHGLQRAVRKAAGITGPLLALLTSNPVIAVAEAVAVRTA